MSSLRARRLDIGLSTGADVVNNLIISQNVIPDGTIRITNGSQLEIARFNTINGVATFNNLSSPNSITAPSLLVGTGSNRATVSYTTNSARTFTLPDVSSSFFVMSEGNQTINGVKTFSSTINGNAATVTNGVYTTSDQTIGGTKTFSNALILSTQASTTSHAVRADRTITLSGTANQVSVSTGSQDLTADRTWTFSLPQNIHTTATPTFSGLTLNGSMSIQAADTSTAASRFAVFIDTPTSALEIFTRTAAQVRSDIGAAAATHSHTIVWTDGTTAGPTLSVQGGTASAIPSASGTVSGIVTTGNQIFAGNKTFTGSVTSNSSMSDSSGNVREIVNNARAANYTLVLSDVGKLVNNTGGGITIPANVFSAGQAISFYNNSISNRTITANGVTLYFYFAGITNTGNRTIVGRGLCTIVCVGSNTFVILGTGLS